MITGQQAVVTKSKKAISLPPGITKSGIGMGLSGMLGSVSGISGGFFDPPKKATKIRKPTMKNLTTTINNQIRLKKKITELKNKLFTEQQKEKDIRKALEDFEK